MNVGRVVRLEVGGQVGDVGVGHRVGLVEAVLGEGDDLLPELPHLVLGVALGDAALDEVLTLAVDDLPLLLAHRLAQGVRLGHAEAGDLHGDPHHLLLVDDDAVGLGQDLLELGKDVGDGLLAVLAGRVVVDELHRARPVERVEGGDVREGPRLDAAEDVLHPGRLELEDAVGVAGGEELVHRRVVQRHVVEIRRPALGALDRAQGVRDHGEGPQAEEVHLEEAQGLHVVLVVLGGDLVMVGAVEGHQVDQRLRSDDHPGRVHPTVTREPFDLARGLDELAHVRIPVHQLAQLGRVLQRPLDGDVELVRDQLGDPVHVAERHAHDTAHVPHRRAGLENVEGGDLGHRVRAVTLADVLDHPVPLPLAEIDVDVRHRDALRVEEALEEQVVLQGVDVRDAQGVGDHGTRRRAAPGPHRHPVFLGEADEVPDHEEVAGKSHPLDDLELLRQPRPVGGGVVAPGAAVGQPPLEPVPGELGEVGPHGVPLGHRVGGQVEARGVEEDVAPLGDLDGSFARPRVGGEELRHLLRGLDVVLVVVHVASALVQLVDGLVLADPDEQPVGEGVLPVMKVAVVGGHQRDPGALGNLDHPLPDHLLVLGPMILDLQEEVVAAEDLPVLLGGLHRPVEVPAQQAAGDLPGEAGRQADQPLGVLRQDRFGDPRLVVEAVEIPLAHQPDQVPVPGVVLGQEDQVVVRLAAAAHRPALPVVARRHVDLAADHRPQAGRHRGPVELERPEQVAVIGDRHRRHACPGHLLHELGNADHRVEQGVVRVEVQMDERRDVLGPRHAAIIPPPARPGNRPAPAAAGDGPGDPLSIASHRPEGGVHHRMSFPRRISRLPSRHHCEPRRRQGRQEVIEYITLALFATLRPDALIVAIGSFRRGRPPRNDRREPGYTRYSPSRMISTVRPSGWTITARATWTGFPFA